MKSVFSTVPEYIEFSIHFLVGAKTKLTQGFPHASKQVIIIIYNIIVIITIIIMMVRNQHVVHYFFRLQFRAQNSYDLPGLGLLFQVSNVSVQQRIFFPIKS